MYSKFKIKNSLRRVAFGLINFVDSRLYKNSNKVKLIQELRKNVTVLKPGRGNNIVLIDINTILKLPTQRVFFEIVKNIYSLNKTQFCMFSEKFNKKSSLLVN